MGSCFSSWLTDGNRSANVVSINGELRRYSVPVTVSQVLEYEALLTPQSIFLCDSDSLNFDDFIPALDSRDGLDPDQIYFVLPSTKLRFRLTVSDMAALAVKASAAFDQRGRSCKSRISPVMAAEENTRSNYLIQSTFRKGSSTAGLGVSRPSSLKRYASRRAKLAVPSFNMRLNTIHEGSMVAPSWKFFLSNQNYRRKSLLLWTSRFKSGLYYFWISKFRWTYCVKWYIYKPKPKKKNLRVFVLFLARKIYVVYKFIHLCNYLCFNTKICQHSQI